MHLFRSASCQYADTNDLRSVPISVAQSPIVIIQSKSYQNDERTKNTRTRTCNRSSTEKKSKISKQEDSRLFKPTRKIIAGKSLILLLLFSLSKLISTLSISPPSREIALLRLSRTTVDDDELARTMERIGPGQEDDDPLGGGDLARTRELLQAQESSRLKVSRDKHLETTNVTSSIPSSSTTTEATTTTTTALPSSKEEPRELSSDSQIASVSVAPPNERQDSPGFISVINNQSSSVNLDESHTQTSEKILNPEKSFGRTSSDFFETSSHLEMLHNVAMNEPADTIQSLQAHASLSLNETEFDKEQSSPALLTNGHNKREERRRKTAGSDPQKESRSKNDSSRGSIKSVITRAKPTSELQAPNASAKFAVPTKLVQIEPSLPISRSQGANQTLGTRNEETPRTFESRNANSIKNITSFPADQTNNSNLNSLKFGSSSEMRAFESATIETTANGKDNNIDNDDEEDSRENSPDLTPGLATTTEAPSEEPTTSAQQHPNQGPEKLEVISSNSDDKRLVKLVRNAPQQVKPQDQSSKKSFKATHHELLVGPFKSESDAPDTITLAGVVYQKSGSSSGLPAIFAPNSAAGKAGLSAVAASSMRNIETTSLTHPNSPINNNNQIMYQRPESSKLLVQPTIQQQNSKFHNHQEVAQHWTPQALPSNTQLFLPISQAQLITLLGQPGKLLTSARQTIAHAAASAKSKEKSKVSVTLTSIPTGESLLSSLASSLDLKLASPTTADTMDTSQAGKSPFASASTLSQAQNNGDQSDWSASAPQQASTTTTTGNTNNNDATSVEQLYLNSLLQGIGAGGSSNQLETMAMAASSASKDHIKSHPVVIVEKNVKPVKYHLLRAYLKLRRLLRPSDATYVFPASSLKRLQSQSGA